MAAAITTASAAQPSAKLEKGPAASRQRSEGRLSTTALATDACAAGMRAGARIPKQTQLGQQDIDAERNGQLAKEGHLDALFVDGGRCARLVQALERLLDAAQRRRLQRLRAWSPDERESPEPV